MYSKSGMFPSIYSKGAKMKSTIDVSKGNFRLTNIVKLSQRVADEEKTKLENEGYSFKETGGLPNLVCMTLPLSKGIAIEKKTIDGNVVIAYVKAVKGEAKVESVGTRLFDDVSVAEYPTVRSLTKVAFEVVEALNDNENY